MKLLKKHLILGVLILLLLELVIATNHLALSTGNGEYIQTYFFPLVAKPELPAQWSQIGFSGSEITDIAFHPFERDRVFVSAYSLGLFESTNAGATWILHDLHPRVNDIEIRASSPEKMYAATLSSWGIFESSNSGQEWEPVEGWSNIHPLEYSVATHPLNESIIFAGSGNWEFHGGEIFKSQDFGATWESVSGEFLNIREFVFNPHSPDVMYARSNGNVWKSNDGGDSWVNSSNGLPAPIEQKVNDLGIYPLPPSQLYVASDDGLYVSNDSGQTWQVTSARYASTSLVIQGEANPTLYLATVQGLFSSYDAGGSWHKYQDCGQGVNVISMAVNPHNPTSLWMATNDGLWECMLTQ